MKSEKEVKMELSDLRKLRAKTKRDFDRYDNHHDMQKLEELAARIAQLEWVLSDK